MQSEVFIGVIYLEKWGIWKVRIVESHLGYYEGWCEKLSKGTHGMDFKRIELNSEEAAIALAAHLTQLNTDPSGNCTIRYSAKIISDMKGEHYDNIKKANQ